MNQTIKNIFTEKHLIKHLWGGIIPIHLFGFYAIYKIMVGQAPDWWYIPTIVGWFFIKYMGVSIGFHRLFSHNSFKVNNFMKRLLLFCGSLAGQGSAIAWVGVHRGSHHRHSDTIKDPHSPIHGFWHSYILWMFKAKESDINIKKIPDLLRDPDIIFFHRHYYKIIWIIYGLTALINFELCLYLLFLPALITLHIFCLQTSVVHYKKLGYRNYDTNDNSTNVPLLFLTSQGECWHNNHHGDPKNLNFGGRHWWEFDPAYRLIQLIKKP